METREDGKSGRHDTGPRGEGRITPRPAANHAETLVRDPAKGKLIRRSSLTLLTLATVAGCAWLAFGPALPAQVVRDHRKAELEKMKEAIKKNGKLPAGAKGADYWRHGEALHQAKKRTLVATPLQNGGKAAALTNGKAALASGTSSSLIAVGEPPPGFGKGFVWDRADPEIMLVMFINAADPLGVSIEGMQAGDTVQVLSASGIASFSSDKGNPLASSIVGLVAAGAKVVVGAEGAPQAVPAIDAAETFAKEQFKATNAKTKRRDAFGVDPGSGGKARQEGGLLVCLPEAGGTFYSGNGDHKERWVQKDGTRTVENMPAHFNYNAFFPRQGFPEHNTRMVRQTGPMYVLAWDHAFDDNAGFYKIFVKLTKGNGPPSDPIPRQGPTAKPKVKK